MQRKLKSRGIKTCEWCETIKSLDDFRLRRTKLSKYCKDCEKEISRLDQYMQLNGLVNPVNIFKYGNRNKQPQKIEKSRGFHKPVFAKPLCYEDYLKKQETTDDKWKKILARAK